MISFLGKSINGYRIEGLVGEGGMGSVFVGLHEQTRQKVAIKILYNISYQANPERGKRFKLEASILAKLEHPNIVKIIDFVEDETGRYLVMEFVEGKLVEDMIRFKDEEEKIRIITDIFVQLLDGVGYAHQQNVIHRDLKPSNILVTKNLKVKLLDFGVAKLREEEQHHLTRTGASVGTTYYMSPEQVKGQKVEIASDIYSLGVLLYEMFTGENPYAVGNLSHYEINQKIVKETMPRLSMSDKNLTERLNRVIARATDKNPHRRFRSCQEFRAHFKAAVGVELTPEDKKYLSTPIRIPYKKVALISLGLLAIAALAMLIVSPGKGGKSEKSAFVHLGKKFPERKNIVGPIPVDTTENTVNLNPRDTNHTTAPPETTVVETDPPSKYITAEANTERVKMGTYRIYYSLKNNSDKTFSDVSIRMDLYDSYGYVEGRVMQMSMGSGEYKEGMQTIETDYDIQSVKIRVVDKPGSPYGK